MIIWRCDGCGKTEETRFEISGCYPYVFEYGPRAPDDWWVATVDMPNRDRDSMRQRARNAYHACCGTCADKASKATSGLHWVAA